MTDRQCSPCTACCTGWLSAEIKGVKLLPGKPCKFLVKDGCGIYESRPKDPCASFRCGWLQEPDELPEHMRPSESGVIIMLDRPWHKRQVIRAVPTSETIPADTIEWLKAYSRQRLIPLLFLEHLFKDGKYIGRKYLGYGPQSFIRAVEVEVEPEDVMTF